MEAFRQLSLFDVGLMGHPAAVNQFDRSESQTTDMADWMAHLVPKGEFLIMVGTHPCVLQRTKLKPEEVSKGLEFCHYLVGGAVYSGIFVGTEVNGIEKEGDESDDL